MTNIGIYIGRFQPLHNGHISIINEGLKKEDFMIIIIGSKNKKNDRNPFSYDIRKNIITEYFGDKNYFVEGLDDYDDDYTWTKKLEEIINQIILNNNFTNCRLKLYCPKKDESTIKYLDYVIENSFIKEYQDCNLIENNNTYINSTLIREYMKDKSTFEEKVKDLIPFKIISKYI
jgi:cytidyltransferase-like protein